MDKLIYSEPAFLRDIHRIQIMNYNKTMSMGISERINCLLKKAEKQVKKAGYHVIKRPQIV